MLVATACEDTDVMYGAGPMLSGEGLEREDGEHSSSSVSSRLVAGEAEVYDSDALEDFTVLSRS